MNTVEMEQRRWGVGGRTNTSGAELRWLARSQFKVHGETPLVSLLSRDLPVIRQIATTLLFQQRPPVTGVTVPLQ